MVSLGNLVMLCLNLQLMYLREVAEYMDIPATNPQRFIPHRWLSAYDVGMHTKRMLPVYKVLYFGFMGKEDKALYKDPLQQLYTDYHVSEKAQRRIAFLHQDLSKKGMYIVIVKLFNRI